MIFKPREYQEQIRNFALEHSRCNIFAGMGMGKTTSALDTFDALQFFGEAKHALILAPRRVALLTWPGEVAKWRESFGHLPMTVAIGSPAARIEALKKRAAVTTINYDNLPWLVETLGEHWFFDTVIADESTNLKGLRVSLHKSKTGKTVMRGQGSVRARAIAKVAHKKVRRWVNLTGSPAPNGLQDLWGQMWFVDGGRRLGSSFSAFEDRFFRQIPNSGGYGVRLELLPHAAPLIHDKIRDVSITVDPKDWFDIQAPIERLVEVELPPAARSAYDAMEQELFAEVFSARPSFAEKSDLDEEKSVV